MLSQSISTATDTVCARLYAGTSESDLRRSEGLELAARRRGTKSAERIRKSPVAAQRTTVETHRIAAPSAPSSQKGAAATHLLALCTHDATKKESGQVPARARQTGRPTLGRARQLQSSGMHSPGSQKRNTKGQHNDDSEVEMVVDRDRRSCCGTGRAT